MKTVRSSCYAKVNLFLDIVGENNGYHMLDSIVVTINIKDKVLLKSRSDNKITLKCYEWGTLPTKENNAYRAAESFMQRYSTNGVDIELKKDIPIGSGLGGSSADIVAVIKGMAQLYGINEDLKPLADSLGSDCGYLLSGGYARLNGRGENVELLDINKKLFMVVALPNGGVNTADCFKLYDKIGVKTNEKKSETLVNRLIGGDIQGEDVYNCLFESASNLNTEVAEVYNELKNLSPKAISMSGSGAAIFAIFDTLELCEWAKSKLKRKSFKTIVCETLSKNELETKPWFFRSIYKI